MRADRVLKLNNALLSHWQREGLLDCYLGQRVEAPRHVEQLFQTIRRTLNFSRILRRGITNDSEELISRNVHLLKLVGGGRIESVRHLGGRGVAVAS